MVIRVGLVAPADHLASGGRPVIGVVDEASLCPRELPSDAGELTLGKEELRVVAADVGAVGAFGLDVLQLAVEVANHGHRATELVDDRGLFPLELLERDQPEWRALLFGSTVSVN